MSGLVRAKLRVHPYGYSVEPVVCPGAQANGGVAPFGFPLYCHQLAADGTPRWCVACQFIARDERGLMRLSTLEHAAARSRIDPDHVQQVTVMCLLHGGRDLTIGVLP